MSTDIWSVKSVGIDVGTTTTQLIFSNITLKVSRGYGAIPKTEIISREIFYESPIFFTPLLSREAIDGKGVLALIRREYEKAQVAAEDITTGAVIITGESSRKENARRVVEILSSFAGDFVVTAAGTDLESLLSGRGSGAADYSARNGLRVVNIDIGGGTTNISIFENGTALDTACLDLGGRLVQTDGERIFYVAPGLRPFIEANGLDIREGGKCSGMELERLCRGMADILAEGLGLKHPSGFTNCFWSGHGLKESIGKGRLMYSGGVAACMKEETAPWAYGDIGVLLARAVREQPELKQNSLAPQEWGESRRATVIGAGNFTMELSGSTVEYQNFIFPQKNVAVIAFDGLSPESFAEKRRIYGNGATALCLEGEKSPSFESMCSLGESIFRLADQARPRPESLIVIVWHDIAKALGQFLKRRFPPGYPFLCIDGISCQEGEYIDVGEPVGAGRTVPVIIKTLLFREGKTHEAENGSGQKNL